MTREQLEHLLRAGRRRSKDPGKLPVGYREGVLVASLISALRLAQRATHPPPRTVQRPRRTVRRPPGRLSNLVGPSDDLSGRLSDLLGPSDDLSDGSKSSSDHPMTSS